MPSPRSAANRPRAGEMSALCPDCDGQGRTIVTFGLLKGAAGRAAHVMETVALRECAVCSGAGWYDPSHGR
ncbi:MAG: hypothetical protein ACRDVE_19585 [Actinocrinis sp.]